MGAQTHTYKTLHRATHTSCIVSFYARKKPVQEQAAQEHKKSQQVRLQDAVDDDDGGDDDDDSDFPTAPINWKINYSCYNRIERGEIERAHS